MNGMIDLESIPGQIGLAVLDLQGSIIRCEGQLTEDEVMILFQMISKTWWLLTEKERLVVSGITHQFSTTRDANNIYMVKTTKTG